MQSLNEESAKILQLPSDALQDLQKFADPAFVSEWNSAEQSDKSRKQYFSLDLCRNALKESGITVRKNVMSQEIELVDLPPDWQSENSLNTFPIIMSDYLRAVHGVKGASKIAVGDALEVIAEENRYNPVLEMLYSGTWDGEDRLKQIHEILGITQDSFSMQLVYKSKLQDIAMAHNDPAHPYGAEGVLTLQGGQGIGKTSFLRTLCSPVPHMFKGGATLDPTNKDTIIQATSHWIVELGELERTTRYESSHLKAILTAESDQYRAPYARTAIKRPRRTSFCASVNPGEFLIDDTGNRRFWTVPIKNIDLDRLFSLSVDWVRQFWYQMLLEWKEYPDGFRLSASERGWLEKVNSGYTKSLPVEEEIKFLLDYDMPIENWQTVFPAELAKKIVPTPPAEKVGRALAKLARQDERMKAKRVTAGQPYRLPLRQTVSPTWDY